MVMANRFQLPLDQVLSLFDGDQGSQKLEMQLSRAKI
jgi:hypothetical protein